MDLRVKVEPRPQVDQEIATEPSDREEVEVAGELAEVEVGMVAVVVILIALVEDRPTLETS